jgi:hypothetical protein
MAFLSLNSLKPSGMPAALTISNSTLRIYGFRIILGVNRDYSLKQR